MTTEAIIEAKSLTKALKFAKEVIEKSSIPAIETVLIEARADVFTVISTDLVRVLRYPVQTIQHTDGAVCVDPKLMLDLLSKEKGVAEIRFSDSSFILWADGAQTEIGNIIPHTDFPKFKDAPLTLACTIEARNLARALNTLRYTTPKDAARYYLNGIYMHKGPKGLRMVSTDGHRLGRYDVPVVWAGPDFILPQKTALILLKLLSDKEFSNCLVDIHASKSQLCFSCARWSLTTKVVDGTFPDYVRVIPSSGPNFSATIDPSHIPKTAIGARAVILDCGNQKLTFINGKTSNSRYLDASGDVAAAFNADYLADFGKALGGHFNMSGKNAGDPALITSQDHPDFLGVIMPMRA